MGFYFKMGHYQKAPALGYCGGVEGKWPAVGEAETDQLKNRRWQEIDWVRILVMAKTFL